GRSTGSRRRDLSDRVLGRMSGDDVLRPVALVVDDEESVRESFRLVLDQDYDVLDVPDGARALDIVRAHHVDIVLLDIRLPEMDGIEVLERIKALDDSVEVILVTAVKTVRTAVAAMKLGALDYLTKPFEDEELLSLVRRAVEKRSLEREVTFLRGELARSRDRDEIIGEHSEMQKLARLVAQVARTTTTVLITGESGTGKELIARAIHHRGPRRDKPFVPVNPAAIPDALVESELFGHEKGAFTGAHQRKLGRFELAQGGTLFLDEIGLLRAEVQAKLLRVLQEREIERVGGTRSIKIDVRTMVLVDGPLIGPADLPLDVTVAPGRSGPGQAPETLRMDLNQASDRFERIIVQRVLEEVGGNVSEAARVLGLHRNSLKLKLARWKLTGGESEESDAQ